MNRKIKKAVIPVAGMGTRFLPVTKAIAKEMIPIIDRPMVQYTVEEAIESGIETIVLITSQHKASIENYFDFNYELEDRLLKSGKAELAKSLRKISESCSIVSVRQKEPAGLGHAIGCAKSVVGNDPFAILLGDDLIVSDQKPCTQQLIEVYEKHGTSVVGVMEVPEKEVTKYGIVKGSPVGSDSKTLKVETVIEKPSVETAPSRLAIPGRYILDAKVFDYISKVKPGKNGEIQLTDALLMLAQNEGLLAHLFRGDRYDTGDRLGYLEATIAFAFKRPDVKEHMKALLKKYAQ